MRATMQGLKRQRTRRRVRPIAILSIVGAVPIAAALMLPLIEPPQSVDFARVAAVAKAYPNFTVRQQRAVMAEIRSEQHPLWKTLPMAGRIKRAATFALRAVRQHVAAAELGSAVNAPFVGNSTFITNPNGNAIALQRQSNCSLSLFDGSYTYASSTTMATLQFNLITANFEQTLHSEAQLTTTADVFAGGCVDPTSGFSTRRGVYLGKTAPGGALGAGAGYDSFQNTNALYSGTVDP